MEECCSVVVVDVEVVLGFPLEGLDGCEGVFSCDVDVVVGVGEAAGSDDDDINCDIGFWRGMNWMP